MRDDEDAPLPVAGMGPIVTALDDLPAVPLDGVVLANELLDNLPFRIVERRDGTWWEVRVAVDGDALVESRRARGGASSRPRPTSWSPTRPTARASPCRRRSSSWLRACAVALRRGRLVVSTTWRPGRSWWRGGERGWLRTYRDHDRGGAPLAAPGDQDLTIDVPLEYLVHAAATRRAAPRARSRPGRRGWPSSGSTASWPTPVTSGTPVLTSVTSRRCANAAASPRVPRSLDPSGLGAHRVLVFTR